MRIKDYLLISVTTMLAYSCGSDATQPNDNPTTNATPVDTIIEGSELVENDLETLRFRLDMLVANHGAAPVSMLMKLSADDKDVFHPDYVIFKVSRLIKKMF